ncbi:unnamed protein product [Nippostrongylus brasiliensis]|uniref:Ion_trans domain-containing protein n=1 Tax=Nippostrongylus brasiliensis TaxID=27835 RepID=A0A0N4YB40_NIPBR|nr:unnamed protein product [Nippostrongylus brasiliensis]
MSKKHLIRFMSRDGEKLSMQQFSCPHLFTVDSRELRIIQMLNDFENEEKLFQTFDIVDHDSRYSTVGAAIYAFINARLRGVLKCSVHELADEELQGIICNSFFKRNELLKIWNQCSLPLFSGLLAAYICHSMKNIFYETHEPVIAEQYRALQEKLDDECTFLLDQCFFKNEKFTRGCLELNYIKIIQPYKESTSDTLELMFLASLGKAQNFLAHPCCQRVIERRWQPGFKVGTVSNICMIRFSAGFQLSSEVSFYVYFFCPLLFLQRGPQRLKRRDHRAPSSGGRSSRKSNIWSRIYYFYTSPNSKYVIHILFRVFYILFYAFVLVTITRKNIKVNNISEFWDEIVRIFAIPLADFTFYLSFVYATIRSLRILNVDSFFGSIVLMIRKMLEILIKFLFVFLVFWFTYAVCHISLAGHYKETPNITDITLPWLLFINGAFEIFGEADDEDKTGNVSDCTQANFNWDDITETSVQCWFKTTMVPIVLFSYMLVSSIMLVNLVTALLTKKYEEVSRYSHIYWKYKLYERLVEYEEKLWVPSPFSIFYYLVRGVVYLIFSAFANIGINYPWLLYLPKKALSFLNNFEGDFSIKSILI